jgi:hypothetical protein
MVANRPARSTRQPQLIGTHQASEMLEIPHRTIKRWVHDRSIGMMVAGRRLLRPADVRALKAIRDQVA